MDERINSGWEDSSAKKTTKMHWALMTCKRSGPHKANWKNQTRDLSVPTEPVLSIALKDPNLAPANDLVASSVETK